MKMTSKHVSIASICLMLGVLGLLPRAVAQTPERSYAEIVAEYDARMDRIEEQLNATLPHSGPLTDYQLRLISELKAPKPRALLQAEGACLVNAASDTDLITDLDSANKVTVRGSEFHRFRTKTGWTLSYPSLTGTTHELEKDPQRQSSTRATLFMADVNNVGDTVSSIGQVGWGRIKISCTNGETTYDLRWRWTLFRDCPNH